MKQGLYSNGWISAEIQSAEINPKAYREEVSLVVSLKTLFEKLNPVKSYNKSMEKIQVGLNFCWPVYF